MKRVGEALIELKYCMSLISEAVVTLKRAIDEEYQAVALSEDGMRKCRWCGKSCGDLHDYCSETCRAESENMSS